MVRFAANTRKGLPLRSVLGRLVLSCLACVPVATSVASSSAIPPQTLQSDIRKPDPEALLIEIYKDLGNNRLQEAQAKADALVAAYPHFRLGHLVRGDLLMMHARPVRGFGARLLYRPTSPPESTVARFHAAPSNVASRRSPPVL